jgi:DNA-binding LacI/PurR family transcriptional regulator
VSVTSVRERLRGYRQALEDHNITYDEELIWLDIYKKLDKSPASIPALESAYKDLQIKIEQQRPTVLISINRIVQEQVVHDLLTIREKKLENANAEEHTGFHIDVASFTNESPCVPNDFMVALALQSDETLGETAMKLLIDRINGKFSDPPVSKKIPMRIVDLRVSQ